MNSTGTTGNPQERTRRSLDLLTLGAVWAVAALVLYFAVRPGLSLALHYDEVDYVNAASQGILTNATDATALSARDFLEVVRSRLQGRPSRVSPDYDETRDVFLLRHSHPPLLHYTLALTGHERLAPGHERTLRLVQYAGGVLLIGTMLWGYARMASRPGLAGMILLAACGVLCAFYLSRELNCHLWIAVMLVPVGLAVGRFVRDPSPSAGLCAGAALGLAFLGLQTGLFAAFWAVVAVGIATISGAFEPVAAGGRRLRQSLRLWTVRSVSMVAGFFAIVLVTYPGAIFRLSLLRIFALYAYAIAGGSEYASVTDVKIRILPMILPMLALGLTGIAGLALRRDLASRHFLLAMAVIGFGYALIMQKFLLNVTYITPALVLMSVLGSAVLASVCPKPLQWISAGAVAAYAAWILATFAPADLTHAPVAQVERLADVVGSRRAWIDGAHVVRYYCPEISGRIGSITLAENGSLLTTRNPKTLRYEPIKDDDLAGSVVMLGVFNGHPPYEWELHLPEGTRKLDSPVGKGRIYLLPDKMPARADSADTSTGTGNPEEPKRNDAP